MKKVKKTKNFRLFFFKNQNFIQESVLDQPTRVENNELLQEIDYQNLEAEKEKFNAAIDTLDSALVRLEQLWITNV